MVSSNHFLLFVQLFAVISTSSPDCVEPHAPGTPNGTCPPQPEPSRCCPEPLQPPFPVTPYAATKPTASTSSSHPENYKYSQPCTARLSGQWNGAAATMVSSNHFLLFVQLFAVISTSSPDCVEPHAPGTPNGTCPPQPEPSRCCPEPLQPPFPVTPYAATKPTASTSSSHPENYKYSQPCTARLSGQWNGAAATMVSSNHFLLFVQLFAVISTSSPDCVEPHAPGTPNGTCPPQPEPSCCCPEPLQPPFPVTPYAATKPTASTSSSHPENYKYSQPCTARLSGQWNGAAATMVSSNHFLLFVQPPVRSELFEEVDFNKVPTPLESVIMATDGSGLEASMGRLSLDSIASQHRTQGGNRHSGTTSFYHSSEKDKLDHTTMRDSFDEPTTIQNSKAGDKLGIALYALVCWLMKELVSKCSTETLAELVTKIIPICDRNGNNAVHVAVRHPSYVLNPVLKILASTKKYSVCINKQNNGGQTPLHLAAQGGRHDLVTILLRRGADCGLVDCAGRTILHCAVLGSLPKGTLNAILSQPQVDHSVIDKEGKTALHLAVERRKTDALQTLCQAGLDVNAAVDDGTRNRPLHLAIIADFVDGINILLKQDSIQVAAVNSDGMDALGIALDMKQEGIVEVLLVHRELQEGKKNIGLIEMEQFRGESQKAEKFWTSALAKSESGHANIRSRVVEALECEDNATRVLGLLHEGSTEAVLNKMVAFLRVSGLGNAIYKKYLQNYDDDSLQTLFVEVLGIPLN
ncbi:hypothetical protein MRX96_059264 [Rhipicephalus microplus]